MYTTATCNIRQEPTTDSEIVGTAGYGTEISVIGKTTYNGKDWYQVLVTGTEQEFISASLLSETKPEVKAPVQTTDSSTGQTLEDNSPATTNPTGVTSEHKAGDVIGQFRLDDGTTVDVIQGSSDEEFENWNPGW